MAANVADADNPAMARNEKACKCLDYSNRPQKFVSNTKRGGTRGGSGSSHSKKGGNWSRGSEGGYPRGGNLSRYLGGGSTCPAIQGGVAMWVLDQVT